MEEEWFFQQQGNKVTPKELKDCPDCGKPRISFGWGGFSSVYSALWMEGPRWIWDDGAQEWTRAGPMNVALKRLDNSQNISSSYIDQIKAYHKCLQSASLAGAFGITKDPTSNYMIVMKYYENAYDICNGERLEIPEDTPNFYSELMQQCWDNDPVKRPTASYLNEKLGEWIILICDDPTPSKVSDENSIAEEKRWKMISQLSKKITHPELHPEAYYTRLTTVSFPNYNDSNVRGRYKKFFHSYLSNVNVNHVNCRPHYVHSSVEPRPNRTQFIIPARIEILGPINEFTRFHEIHSEFI
ncbi:unnamed protein product [Rhizophagus irregularis]|uniref:Serine-threonine/tyrosine-protein kinase catalytic domain-containing protein n=1 Tax=Rhizophagus irregularis TaxID=588596 RepID=A0A915ZYH6_9GLOM|nr:unnamed protein product [Rhizophagus irregularis]